MLWEASMILMMEYHNPVLLNQCIDFLQVRPDGIYVDVTFGGGGHSRAILEQLKEGKLYAFDQDPEAKNNAPESENFELIGSNFRFLEKMLRVKGITQVDGLLADLGVSSHQFDKEERGFSIRFDGPLDMRMNPGKSKSAREVVNTYELDELIRIFRFYGELQNPHKLAHALLNHRADGPINTTFELKEALKALEPRTRQAQFWAKVFQAIRIEVNEELEVIKEMLMQTVKLIKPGGRLVVMSYHSLEDRLIKNFFRSGNFDGEPQQDFYGNLIRPFDPVNRKPIVAEEEEVIANPRARSAKLRVAERRHE